MKRTTRLWLALLVATALLSSFAAPSFGAAPGTVKLRLDGFPTWTIPELPLGFVIEEDRWVLLSGGFESVFCTGRVEGKPLRKAELKPGPSCRGSFEEAIAVMIESLIVSDNPIDAQVAIEKIKIKVRKKKGGYASIRVKVKFEATTTLFGPVSGKFKLNALALLANKIEDDAYHALMVGRDGSGGVVSAGNAIQCGDDCGETYNTHSIVVLTATPNPGYLFTGWKGCDSVSGNQCTVLVEHLRVVQAGFRLKVILVPDVI